MPVGWVCLWDCRIISPTPYCSCWVTNACRLGVSLGHQKLPRQDTLHHALVTNACRLGVSLGQGWELVGDRSSYRLVTNACRLGVSLGHGMEAATASIHAASSPMPVGWVCLWDV